MPTNADPQHKNGSTGTRGKWVLIGFLAITGFFLLAEHRAHLFGILPYLLLLVCLLMHFFHGHGNHKGHSGSDDHKHHEDQSSQGKQK